MDQTEHPDIAVLLINAGANLNIKDRTGQSAAHAACACGSSRIVAKLLALPGVRWDEEDIAGNTPAKCAKKGGFGVLAEKVQRHVASTAAAAAAAASI